MEISSPAILDCLDELRTNAPRTDQQPCLSREVLRELGRRGLYRLAVAKELGGLGASAAELWDVSEALAGACGTTNFVQAQHQGGIGFVARSSNQPLVQSQLAPMLAGERLCGVAFAHCRRPQSPLQVIREGDGLVFDGEAPWCSGWGLLDELVVAGRDDRGMDVYALVPAASPGLSAQSPVKLSAMNASSTVSLKLERVRVSSERWLFEQTAVEMAQRDFRSQLSYAALPLGLTREACRLIQERRPGSAAVEVFLTSCQDLRARALAWTGGEQEALEIRSQANLLGQRAAQAAVVAVGGQANHIEHPACRLLREASFYFLTQLNEPLREAYLAKLAKASS